MSNTVIRVGGLAPVLSFFADYLDGNSATLHRASLSVKETANGPVLVIDPPEAPSTYWPLSQIRQLPDQAARDVMVLSLASNPVARLLVEDKEARSILRARCNNLHRPAQGKGHGRLLAWSAAALASVFLIIFVLVPVMADQLAGYLPPKGEKALGDATFEQIRRAIGDNTSLPIKVCTGAKGTAALGWMQAQLLAETDLPYPLSVSVLDHGLVNAFALPGGRVVLFRGLIDKAQSPDEVAAVLAHEIGHVVNRDPTRGALRSAGSIGVLGLLFGDFAGGTAVLFMLNRLIDATYSQEAEAKADAFAHRTLVGAGVRPSALGDMFKRLQKTDQEPDGIVAHFRAHPQLGDRIQAAYMADENMTAESRPSLNIKDWKALQSICD